METLADDRVCRSCGVSFSVICSNCQHPNLGAARFCGACGDRLDQPQALGERKVVTVLFADIVGSTELIGDKDPEQYAVHSYTIADYDAVAIMALAMTEAKSTGPPTTSVSSPR